MMLNILNQIIERWVLIMFNDVREKMLGSRIILLNGEINGENSNEIIMQLLYLDSINNDDIYLYIDSPGGEVREGLAIIDCMNYISSNVVTICIGAAYSMASVILCSGEKGKRYALPNSEIMIHEPSCDISGKAKDVILKSDRIHKTNKKLAKIISDNSKKTYSNVFEDMKTDYFMSATKAKRYGIIDEIIFKSNMIDRA